MMPSAPACLRVFAHFDRVSAFRHARFRLITGNRPAIHFFDDNFSCSFCTSSSFIA